MFEFVIGRVFSTGMRRGTGPEGACTPYHGNRGWTGWIAGDPVPGPGCFVGNEPGVSGCGAVFVRRGQTRRRFSSRDAKR